MSKPIRYDSLLVRALARALNERYAGRPVRAIRVASGTRTLRVITGRRALVWNLDPAAGGMVERRREPGPMRGHVLPRGTRTTAIVARPDDRIIDWVLETTAGGSDVPAATLHLLVELLPNRRNAVLTDDGRVLASLAPVSTRVTGGASYAPPEPRPRSGWDAPLDRDRFVALLRDVPPAERERALLRDVAWTSTLNATAIIGDASVSDGDSLDRAWERYAKLVGASDDRSGIVEPEGARQPYPVALPGMAFTACDDLMAAFAAASRGNDMEAESGTEAVIETVRRRIATVEARMRRLEEESLGAGAEADRLRRQADLLLAQLGRTRRGMRTVELDDWNGGTETVELEPALDGAANANALYDRARKRERAAQRLPAAIAKARIERDRLAALEARIVEGTASTEEMARFVPVPRTPTRRTADSPALPYRRYRTTGGFEVRVGRGSRANDELTLRHASPNDIWLHARDVAGAHVVLRWTDREQNPPAADLTQAAVLAALHSRARTSGVVPVDWTRRKYVRKPRGFPPGRVAVERARTIFVEPDPGIEARLRDTP